MSKSCTGHIHIGLPIGNLTSHIFANIYLNELDHFVKDRLRLRWYGRYMDDFYILHADKKFLREMSYDHILIRGNTLLRMRRNLRDKQKQLENDSLQKEDLLASKATILGHLKHADSYGLIKNLFE